MDWIEKLAGFSPDGRNGAFEALYSIAILVLVAVLIVVIARRLSRSRGR